MNSQFRKVCKKTETLKLCLIITPGISFLHSLIYCFSKTKISSLYFSLPCSLHLGLPHSLTYVFVFKCCMTSMLYFFYIHICISWHCPWPCFFFQMQYGSHTHTWGWTKNFARTILHFTSIVLSNILKHINHLQKIETNFTIPPESISRY